MNFGTHTKRSSGERDRERERVHPMVITISLKGMIMAMMMLMVQQMQENAISCSISAGSLHSSLKMPASIINYRVLGTAGYQHAAIVVAPKGVTHTHIPLSNPSTT